VECNLVWNYTRDFKIERARSASSTWNHKYDFRPKLHDTKFNCQFIRSILKSHNFIALNFRFLVYCSSSRFVKKKRKRNRLYVSFSMQNDVMWRKLIRAWQRNKQFWSEVRTKIVYFRYKSSVLVAWINYGRRSFLLWLRLRLFRCLWRRNLKVHILCNSAIDFFWVVKLSRVHDAQWIVRFFSFKYRSMAWF